MPFFTNDWQSCLRATLPVPMAENRRYLNGKRIGKPKGQREGVHQKNNKIIYGNGCKFHGDCFDCPFSDCIIPQNEV